MPKIEDHDWQAVSEHLDHALELAVIERERYVASLAIDKPRVAAYVRKLLDAGREDGFGRFLTDPVSHADPSPAALHTGRKVGPYEIDAEIGQGGMGSV